MAAFENARNLVGVCPNEYLLLVRAARRLPAGYNPPHRKKERRHGREVEIPITIQCPGDEAKIL